MIEGFDIVNNPTAIRFINDMTGTRLDLVTGVTKNPYQKKRYRLGRGLGTRQISLLKVAEFHEMGWGQHRRSFIASTFAENKKRVHKDLVSLIKRAGRTKRQKVIEPGLRKIGGYLASKMKRKFFGSNNWRALSRNTRPNDRNRKPLLATHQLANSIGYVVIRGKVR